MPPYRSKLVRPKGYLANAEQSGIIVDLPWGSLPQEDDYIKSGYIAKELLDFTWKTSFVALTAHEILLASNQSANIADRYVHVQALR